MDNLTRVDNFLTQAKTFYLATTEDRQPKCRPMGLHLLLDGVLYFGVGGFKNVYKQMRINPLVEICATVENNFVRYFGTAVFEMDGQVAERTLEGAPYLRKIYNEQNGNKLEIFHLENATAEFHAMNGAIEKLSF